jgi:hypothetical protein
VPKADDSPTCSVEVKNYVELYLHTTEPLGVVLCQVAFIPDVASLLRLGGKSNSSSSEGADMWRI